MRGTRRYFRIKRVPEGKPVNRDTDNPELALSGSQIAIPGLGRVRTGVYHPNMHDTNAPTKPKLELVDQK